MVRPRFTRTAAEKAHIKAAMQRRFGRLNDSNIDFTPTGRGDSRIESYQNKSHPVWRDRNNNKKGRVGKMSSMTQNDGHKLSAVDPDIVQSDSDACTKSGSQNSPK